jgi:AMMECR1 domain-containing protein
MGLGQIININSAFQDHRFHPMTKKELPLLECTVTLLTNFEPVSDPLDWEIGRHGVRLSFTHTDRRGRESRAGSTYLPEVIREQGWTKDEALDSLISKALDHQVDRNSASWKAVSNLEVQRYQGSKESLDYSKWMEFREWIEETGRSGQLV